MIISNNLIGKIPFPKDAIKRINLAWVNEKEAEKILKSAKHDIYLDYPRGRTKPPVPQMELSTAIELANKYKVKYFAVSNIEEVEYVIWIKNLLPAETTFVPKIETITGVKNINEIAREVDMVMLDKEDLYVDCKKLGVDFNKLVDKVRNTKGIRVLELKGVIFD